MDLAIAYRGGCTFERKAYLAKLRGYRSLLVLDVTGDREPDSDKFTMAASGEQYGAVAQPMYLSSEDLCAVLGRSGNANCVPDFRSGALSFEDHS